MKITKSYLKQVIKEELSRLTESFSTGDAVQYIRDKDPNRVYRVKKVLSNDKAIIVAVSRENGKPIGEEPIEVNPEYDIYPHPEFSPYR